MKKYFQLMSIVFCLVSLLTGCNDPVPTSDQTQRQKQEALSQQGNALVGMPAIVSFAEKRQLKDILELRDKTPVTYVYETDMNGKLHLRCVGVGYGFSGATQYTNPQRVVEPGVTGGQYAYLTLPQADPNGLFSPASDEGTWVMCKDPSSDKIAPVRFEPRMTISPFKLD